MKKIKTKVNIDGKKFKKVSLECDKCGGKVEKTKLKKHLGNKVYEYEHKCKICGISEFLNKEYPLIRR